MTEPEFQARCRGSKSGCSLNPDRENELTDVEEFFKVYAVYVLLAALLQRQGQR